MLFCIGTVTSTPSRSIWSFASFTLRIIPAPCEDPTMPWYQLDDANDPKLDELAKKYNLHPLHIEDARSADESVKVDTAPHYTFAVFKPVRLEPDPDNPGEQMPVFSPIDIFAGKNFLITISDPTCPTTQQALDRARRDGDDEHPGKLLYLILDTIVDLYFPAIDPFHDRINYHD